MCIRDSTHTHTHTHTHTYIKESEKGKKERDTKGDLKKRDRQTHNQTFQTDTNRYANRQTGMQTQKNKQAPDRQTSKQIIKTGMQADR